MDKDTLTEIAHDIWVAAQLLPHEGIEDGVSRIEKILAAKFMNLTINRLPGGPK